MEKTDRKRAGKQSLSWYVCKTTPCVFQRHSLENWLCVTTYALQGPHGAKKNSHPLAWLAVSSLLKRKKNRNIIASYKSYHSALLPLTPQSVRSLWCLSSRWNVLVSPMWWTEETLREEEMCPPPSIKCARVHSTTTHREEGRGLQGHLWGRFRTGSNSVCFTHVLSKWVRWQDGEFYVWY